MVKSANSADLIVHTSTDQALQRLLKNSAHAVLLSGLPGSGKSTLSRFLAAGLLGREEKELAKYPYLTTLAPVENKAIPIDSIREIQKFMTLKIPGEMSSDQVSRVVIIEDAHLLTVEAQNALLKTLEEPPQNTVLIMTATSPEALLATIRSRVRTITVVPPEIDVLKDFFVRQDFSTQDIDRALLVSGGLPGLTQALLTSQESHPLYEATVQVRTLLQVKAYDRLLLVDGLSKQKQLTQDICFILGQMSRMALMRSQDTSSQASKRWQRIMKASYDATEQMRRNTQAKLVLMNLMLEL